MKPFLIIRETRSTKELDAFWEKVQEVAFTQLPQLYILNGEIKKDWRSTDINQVAMAELARERAVTVAVRTHPAPAPRTQPYHFSLYLQTGPEARDHLETIIQEDKKSEEVHAVREGQGKTSNQTMLTNR